MSDATCKTCPYWACFLGEQPGGRCCKHTPVYYPDHYVDGRAPGFWPVTFSDDWCGEHPERTLSDCPNPIPQLCPVCGGSGRVILSGGSTSAADPLSLTCHGCDGRGWVTP